MARAWLWVAVCVGLGLTGSLARADDTGSQAVDRGGYMGARLEPTSGGLRVASVVPSGPGSRAGLIPGDVIVRANGGPVSTPEVFTHSVRAAGAGAAYPLDVVRGVRHVALVVRLEAVPRVGLTVGSPPPVLVSQVVMGAGPGDLEQLHGRVVLLDFWASWCGPCRMSMPALDVMHGRFAAQGLTVLGITDESASIARAVGAQLGIHYTLASEPSAASRFGVTALPTLVVIDRRGNVRRVTAGVDSHEMAEIGRLVQTLLAEPP